MEKFTCFWIDPDGNSIMTPDSVSHSDFLNRKDIRESIIQKASKINWSKSDIQRHFNTDIAFMAFRIGYIRVTRFMNEIGIEYIGRIKNKKCLVDLISDISYGDSHIVLEEFGTEKFKDFHTVSELKSFIYELDISASGKRSI